MTINSTPVEVLQGQRWVSIPWRKLQVGDIVMVSLIHFYSMGNANYLMMRHGSLNLMILEDCRYDGLL